MASKNNIDINNNPDDEAMSSGGNPKPALTDEIGSAEFYQGEKIIEDIALPGEKRNIKAATVSKEEIYEDKIKKQKAFIASFGRKKEVGEKSGQEKPEYVEEKTTVGRKILFSSLGIVLLVALLGGGYWLWSEKKLKVVSEEASKPVVIPVEEPAQDNSDEEKVVVEVIPPEELKPAEIAVKVLNVGAAAGTAGRIKDFLVSQGYTKNEAGNGQDSALAKSYVFYKEEKFKEKAQAISSLLLKEKKITTEVKEAASAEEKSADVVIQLGKN